MQLNGGISADMQQELKSWFRMIERAAADKKHLVLTNAALEMARHIKAGRLEKMTTFDFLYQTGKLAGLCDDAIQTALATGLTAPPLDVVRSLGSSPGLDVVCLADVKAKPIEWLWKKWIAIGKVSVLAGEGGQGKSTVLCDLTARTTRGREWPDGALGTSAGSVVFLAAEDDVEDTLAPRLLAADADMSKVFNIRSVLTDKSRRSFNMEADLAKLEAEIRRRGDVRLVIVDPISSYLGKIDSHRNSEVRAVLEPLGEMAARLRVAVVCNNHFSKGNGGANSRIIGSVAFVNQARAAFIVTPDAEDNSLFLLMPSKNNIAPIEYGLGYRIEGIVLADQAEEILTSRICWRSEPVRITADQALAAHERSEEDRTAQAEAVEFLKAALGDGPRPAKDVQAEATAKGITAKPLRVARKVIGGTTHKDGMAGGWTWGLPKAPS